MHQCLWKVAIARLIATNINVDGLFSMDPSAAQTPSHPILPPNNPHNLFRLDPCVFNNYACNSVRYCCADGRASAHDCGMIPSCGFKLQNANTFWILPNTNSFVLFGWIIFLHIITDFYISEVLMCIYVCNYMFVKFIHWYMIVWI